MKKHKQTMLCLKRRKGSPFDMHVQ